VGCKEEGGCGAQGLVEIVCAEFVMKTKASNNVTERIETGSSPLGGRPPREKRREVDCDVTLPLTACRATWAAFDCLWLQRRAAGFSRAW
jgi:hypothetical protein